MLKNKQARQALAAVLQPMKDNATVLEIYRSKPSGLVADEDLPCISIYFDDGDIVERGLSGSETAAQIIMEVLAKDINNVDDLLDNISEEALNLLKQSLPAGFTLLDHSGFSYLRDSESAMAAKIDTFNCKF